MKKEPKRKTRNPFAVEVRFKRKQVIPNKKKEEKPSYDE